MKETDKLELALSGLDLTLVNVTRGEQECSDEELARHIRKAIISVRRGNGRDIDLSI